MNDFADMSLFSLFRMEAEQHVAVLSEHLLLLQQGATQADKSDLEALMRAAHSIKGGACIVGLDAAVTLAHNMEDCFVAAQEGKLYFSSANIDMFLQCVYIISDMSQLEETAAPKWLDAHAAQLLQLNQEMRQILADNLTLQQPKEPTQEPAQESTQELVQELAQEPALHISSRQLQHLLDQAGEAKLCWQWFLQQPTKMLALKNNLLTLSSAMQMTKSTPADISHESSRESIHEWQNKIISYAEQYTQIVADYEQRIWEFNSVLERLYHAALRSRMQPFGQRAASLQRTVLETARQLGKQVSLTIHGNDVLVDKDIIEAMDAPLRHVLRNAVDHGIELPEQRQALGKAVVGNINLQVFHNAGYLHVHISDDGAGVDIEQIRQRVIQRGMADAELAKNLNQNELMEFLFLPKFSIKDEVSAISGRGVGLDVVANTIRKLNGSINLHAGTGKGAVFEMHLPLSLSMLRVLLVQIETQHYALPLAKLERVMQVQDVIHVEGKQCIMLDTNAVPLVSLQQLLDIRVKNNDKQQLSVIILQHERRYYGLTVDSFIGEHTLIECPLDTRLGNIRHVRSLATTGNNKAPILVLDVDDILQTIVRLLHAGGVSRMQDTVVNINHANTAGLRILVADDSLTVRETERKLLLAGGYQVETAVDGMEAWHAARHGDFDLIISDVDMPRMDGIALVSRLKSDNRLRDTPVIIVSYKESKEDRLRGMEAGADYYLTKSSFQNDTLLNAVKELIGVPS